MPVYLDHNATTPLDPRVFEVMLPYLQGDMGIYGNASSVHRYGRLTSGAIERAREQVAAAVNVDASQVYFTGSGSESNNWALHNALTEFDSGRISLSAIEHPSLTETVKARVQSPWHLDWLQPDQQGVISSAVTIKPGTRLMMLMLANNETGALQPVQAVAEQAALQGTWMHTDATQALGKIPVDFKALRVQMMTLSSHKLYGPLGAGALIIDKSLRLHPWLLGGDQEKGYRASTENVAAIVGFGQACELAAQEMSARAEHLLKLRQQLEQGLAALPVTVFAADVPRLPNTVQFGVQGIHGETLLLNLDRAGLAVSSGSACHSQVNEPSHVLTAMGIPADEALTAIRVSFGKDSTTEDVKQLLTTLQTLTLADTAIAL